MTEVLRCDADGLRNFAAACEQHALDVCACEVPKVPATGNQATLAAVSTLHTAASGTGEVLATRIRSTAEAISSAAQCYSQTDTQWAGALGGSVDPNEHEIAEVSSMAADLPTYTQKLARISAILEPHLRLSRYVLATPDVNPTQALNGLACRWFDRHSGRPQVGVFIDQLTDIDEALAGLRAEVTGEDFYEPGSTTEVSGLGPGEYAFLQHYADAVTVIVGSCQITVDPPDEYGDLAGLVEPALEIGCVVGCSEYRDDFVSPPFPKEWTQANWGIGPGNPDFPPGVPRGPRL